jgi:peptide/nickel transport system substrate-binding protein
MAIGGEGPDLDRVLHASGLFDVVWANTLEPLVRIGRDGQPVSMLATKWEPSADLTKWRFQLREGVKFHSGEPFAAQDVVATAKYLLALGETSQVLKFVPLKDAVEVDSKTVDLIFANPQPLLPITLNYFLIYPAAVARDNRELARTAVIGTGPYKFVEWVKGQNIKLTRFEGYWGPRPQIADVVVTFRAEQGVRLAALQAREVDWVTDLSPEQAAQAPKVAQGLDPNTFWIRFDEAVQKEWTGSDPLFADERLRLAVDYAMDRKSLVDLFAGQAVPSQGQFASPADFGFDRELKSRPYDLERARALVQQAGAAGKTVTLMGTSDRALHDREVAEAVASMIQKSGLKVSLMVLPFAEVNAYQKTASAGQTKKMVDMLIFPSDVVLESESRFGQIFTKGGTQFALNDLEPTRLFAQVKATADYDKRGQLLAQAWAYVYSHAHYVPLFRPPRLWGLAKNLDWTPDILGNGVVADMKFMD